MQDFALGFVPFVILVGIVAGLILLEPDTGTAAILVLTTVTLFFVAGASLTHLVALAGHRRRRGDAADPDRRLPRRPALRLHRPAETTRPASASRRCSC